MNSFFEDSYINGKILKKLIRLVKNEQISKTITELDYYCELQKNEEKRTKPSPKEELQFIKKLNNAKRNK